MKKIILVFLIIILALSVNIIATEITIGLVAENRGSNHAGAYTLVNMGGAADGTGIITTIEIFAFSTYDLANCKVATFYVESGNFLSTRDIVTIGAVTAGSKQIFTEDSESDPISLSVQEGDFLGMYFDDGGYVEKDGAGEAGLWQIGSDEIPCSNVEFNVLAGDGISLYGIGETVEAEEVNAIFFGTNF